MRYSPVALPFAIAGLILATAAVAQTPPRADQGPSAQIGAPPMPPPRDGAQADMPPPPPPGASVRLDRGPDGAVHLDVRCAERDTTRDCADIAGQLLDRLNAAQKAK